MSMEVQSLIDRIQTEGVNKAEAEKKQIIENAQKEAATLIANAKAEATEIIKNATDESAKLEERAKSAVQQASRDVIIGLRVDLENRLRKVVKESVAGALTPEMMGKIIQAIVQNDQTSDGIELAVAKSISENDINVIKNKVAETYKSQVEIMLRNDFTAGFKVGFKGSDLFLDLSDEALTQIICAYVGPKIATILEAK